MQTPAASSRNWLFSSCYGNLLWMSMSFIWCLLSLWTWTGLTWSSEWPRKPAASFCKSSWFELIYCCFDCCCPGCSFWYKLELLRENCLDLRMASSLNLLMFWRSWRVGNPTEFRFSLKSRSVGISYSRTVGLVSFWLYFRLLELRWLRQFLFVKVNSLTLLDLFVSMSVRNFVDSVSSLSLLKSAERREMWKWCLLFYIF